jgi:hypothetical protein
LKVLSYGDIMDGGVSVFTSVSKIDDNKLIVTFGGAIRIDNPYKYLEEYLNELENILPKQRIEAVELDFQELKFCNSNGFYIIMDIAEMIIDRSEGPIVVKRIKDDDWQQETLPILLNVDEPEIEERTTFEEHSAL